MEKEVYKIVIIGDIGVGKSSLFRRYDTNSFSDIPLPTIKLFFFMILT